MPLDIVMFIAGCAFLGIGVSWWWDAMTAKREARHFDPDNWPEHLGVQFGQRSHGTRVAVVHRTEKRKRK